MDIKYSHDLNVHNSRAAREVVPFLIKLLNSRSVIDIGCGTGTWLKVFQQYGITDIVGVDGEHLKKELLEIDPKNFIEHDLEHNFVLYRRFDLTVSLEVAEHLSLESADRLVSSICKLSDVVLFSAALPMQGGQRHINEKPPQFWISKFAAMDYHLHDILRPAFWDNQKVDWWYKQNMLLFSKAGSLTTKLERFPSFQGKELVHPELFRNRSAENDRRKDELKNINSGRRSLGFYIRLLNRKLKTLTR